jgi:DnaK suppressor protein
MPSKKAATKKKKKTGGKTAGKTARKAPSSRSAPASRKKVGGQSKSARKTTSTSGKKGTSKKASKKKAGAGTKKAAVRKSTSKKTRPVSPKKVVAKPASSKKKASSKSTSTKSAAAPAAAAGGITAAAPAPKEARAPVKSASSALFGPIRGFQPYQPKRGEPYMSDAQLEHFRNILLAWKRELMEEVDRTVLHMKDDAANFPDPNDRATQESEFGLELRTRDRERKLLKKIESALQRIDDRSYGYCEETGDEIGLRRLEARPVATLCVEAQERRELAERQFRDREDYYR